MKKIILFGLLAIILISGIYTLWWYQSTKITSSLLIAISKDDADYAEYSLRHGIFLNYWWRRLNGSTSPLYSAIGNGHKQDGQNKIAEILIRYGADVNAKGIADDSILSAAIIRQMESTAKTLIEKGADVNEIGRGGFRPIHYTIWRLPTLIPYLLQNGAYPNCATEWGQTALHFLVCYDSQDNVVIALNKGADPNYKDNWGRTPLHYSLAYPKNVHLLLEKGGDPNIKCDLTEWETDFDPADPAFHAWLPQSDKIIEENRGGWTSLHYCCAMGYKESAQILLEHGANPDSIDDKGRTPKDIATATGRTEILELFK